MSHFPLSWVQSGLQQLWQQQLRRKLWTYSKYWYGKRFVFRIGMHYPCFLFSFSPPPPPPFMANDTVSGYALIIRKRLSVYSMLHLSTRQVPTFGPNICLGHGRQLLSPSPLSLRQKMWCLWPAQLEPHQAPNKAVVLLVKWKKQRSESLD